ncbi:hypothetical protein NKH77_40465 [Streptomyces sp. M19]
MLKVDTERQLSTALDIVAQATGGFIVQPFLPHTGDMRVYLADGEVIASLTRRPRPGDYLANISQGGSAEATDDHLKVADLCHRIADSLGAEYLCVDWLMTPEGPVLGEWSTASAGFTALPSPSARRSPAPSSAGSSGSSRRGGSGVAEESWYGTAELPLDGRLPVPALTDHLRRALDDLDYPQPPLGAARGPAGPGVPGAVHRDRATPRPAAPGGVRQRPDTRAGSPPWARRRSTTRCGWRARGRRSTRPAWPARTSP